MLNWDILFLLQQEYCNNIEFPMTWERKKLTKAAIPNPNALLDGKKHSFPLHLRSSSWKTDQANNQLVPFSDKSKKS